MALTVTIHAGIRAQYSGTNDLGTPSFQLNRGVTTDLTSGTAVQKADRLFADRRTIAASGSENLDLAGGLTDPLGAALTFAKIKAISVRASGDNENAVVIGGTGSNAFVGPFGAANDTLSIPPGGSLVIAAPGDGWAVTAGTGDLLKIANGGSGTDVDFDIVIVGTSA